MLAPSDTPALTDRQREVYEFVRQRIAARGCGPTIREIGQHIGVRHPNGVMAHLRALEAKGYILRDPVVSRGIRLPERTRLVQLELPLAGDIRAGLPIDCWPQADVADFSRMFATGNAAYRVIDDSLLDEHVARGDMLIASPDGERVGVLRRVGRRQHDAR